MHQPREVAVAIPMYLPALATRAQSRMFDIPSELLAADQPLYLLCSSRKHPSRYVLPKGGVEKGESSIQAALREGWVSHSSLLPHKIAS